MKIEHLYYFLVIANNRSINKASQKLFVSQQHLSRIVAGLEDDLRTTLLERSSTGIELTEKGKLFYNYASKIVDQYDEMRSYFFNTSLPELSQQAEHIHGSCQIVFPFFFSLFLNNFMKKFQMQYPNIDLCCIEGNAYYTMEEIQSSNNLYLIAGSEPQIVELLSQNRLTAYYVDTTDIAFCVNTASPLAEKHLLTTQDIKTARQTGYPRSTWNNALGIQKELFISSNIYQHLESVIENNSICVVPTYLRLGIKNSYPSIALIPFEKSYSNPIYIFHKNTLELTEAEKAVIRFTSEYIQKIIHFDDAKMQQKKNNAL